MPKITITLDHPRSSYGVPVCLIDGQPVDDADALRACMEHLSLTQAELADLTGKSKGAIESYLYRGRPVPAEVFNVLWGLILSAECLSDA